MYFLLYFIVHFKQNPDHLDEEPLRPDLFFENLYDGIAKGSAKTPDPEAEEEDNHGLNKVNPELFKI